MADLALLGGQRHQDCSGLSNDDLPFPLLTPPLTPANLAQVVPYWPHLGDV
jgi:hypothetical protein